MRLGLIGDVHAEDDLLKTAIDRLTKEDKVDRILCTGDVVDGHGDGKAVDRSCALLREANVLVVRGNHDRWIRTDEMRTLPQAHQMTELAVETITYLKSLPSIETLDVDGIDGGPPGKLLLCHGVGPNDMCRLLPDDFGYAISANEDLLKLLFDVSIHFMVGGHTHRIMARRFERGSGRPPLYVVNPGTLAREHEPGFAVLDLRARSVDFHRLEPSRATRISTTALR